MSILKIAGISQESIVDGPGIRLVVFTQGCIHNCRACHNPETHSLSGGKTIKIDEIIDEIKANPLLDGVTFSGGEPFLQAKVLSILGKEIRNLGLNIITYTGYTFEEIVEGSRTNQDWESLLSISDLLIDGRFDLSQKNLLLSFRGSENQRIIDVRKSLENKRIEIVNLEDK